MEKRNIEATREALLNAAEKLMTECSDPSQVTSRAITKEAGVNLAMINYCFGSREALLFEVFGKLKTEAQLTDPEFGNIIKGEFSPKEKLIQIHLRTMTLMLRYFNYTKALTKFVLLNREIAAERGSLSFIMAHFGKRKTEAECRLIAFEISSLHELAVLRHEEIKAVCGIDLTDNAQLENYIRNNINKFLD